MAHCATAAIVNLQVHGKCETITTRWRPVPLTWHFCYRWV